MLKLEDIYRCPRCNEVFYYQTSRSRWLKAFMPNYPVRRFFCGKCVKKYYVKIDPAHLRQIEKERAKSQSSAALKQTS